MHSDRSGTFTSVLAIALLLVGSSRPMQAQAAAQAQEVGRAPTLDDIPRLREFNELTVSPDGRWAAYTTTLLFAVDTSTATGEIVLLDLRQHRTQHVTVSGGVPRALRWSPSGSALAFLAPSSGRTRIWRYSPLDPRAAPQPIAISDSLGGKLLAFAWNPAGTAFAYIAREPGARPAGAAATHTPPRLVLFHDVAGDFTGATSPNYNTDPVGTYVAVTDLHGDPARVLGRHVVSAADGPTVDWSSTDMLLVAGPPIGVSWWRQLTKRELVVLGLAEQVHRDPVRGRAAVGEH
jgi:Periplasmic component of the Tol biopolymer transport system